MPSNNRKTRLYIGRINVSWVKVTTLNVNVNMYERSWARTLYILIKVLQQITCSSLLVVGLVVDDDGWFRCGWISDTSEWSMDFLMKMEKFVVFHLWYPARALHYELMWSDKFELFKLHWHIYQQSTETFLVSFILFNQSALEVQLFALSSIHYPRHEITSFMQWFGFYCLIGSAGVSTLFFSTFAWTIHLLSISIKTLKRALGSIRVIVTCFLLDDEKIKYVS